MKIILLSLSVGVLIIGIHQIMVNGFANSYWIIMFALLGLFGYQYLNRYGKADAQEEVADKGTAANTAKVGKVKKKIKKLG